MQIIGLGQFDMIQRIRGKKKKSLEILVRWSNINGNWYTFYFLTGDSIHANLKNVSSR